MKHSCTILIVSIAILASRASLLSQKYDAELDELLKSLDMIISDTSPQTAQPPAPQPLKPIPSAPSKKIPEVQKKDQKTNFLESFQEKENMSLPSFKKEAAKTYLYALLSEIVESRRTIAGTEVYRRTKLLSHWGKSLAELEAFIWELVNNDVYLPMFFLSNSSSLRNSILTLGKELSETNRLLKTRSLQEHHIGTRAEFEELKPEKTSETLHLKKLTSLLEKQLTPMITGFKNIIEKSGANIEAVKKKNLALVQDAEKFKKEVSSKAASYRPAESAGSSFWDSPYSYSDSTPSYYGDGGYDDSYMNDFFGGNFPEGFGGAPSEGEKTNEEVPGKTGTSSGSLSPDSLSEKKEKPRGRMLLPSSDEDQAEQSDYERTLKEEIITLVNQATTAFNEENIPVVQNSIETIKGEGGKKQALAFLETTLPEKRKNAQWHELHTRYEQSLKQLQELEQKLRSTKAGIVITEAMEKNIEKDTEEKKEKLKAIQSEEEIKLQQAIENIKPYFNDIAFIAGLIAEINKENILGTDPNNFAEEQKDLESLKALSSKIPLEKLNETLRPLPCLLKFLKSIELVLKNRQENKTLTLTLDKIKAMEDNINNFITIHKQTVEKIGSAFTPALKK